MKKNVFLALTTYQLMVSDIYASYIKDLYNEKSIIIYLGNENKINISSDVYEFYQLPNLNKNAISRIWQRLYYSGRLFKFCPIHKLIKDIDHSFLFIFNDYYPLSRALIEFMVLNNNTVCLIEEGIGTYAIYSKSIFSMKDYIRNAITKLLGSPMVYSAIGESSEIKYAIVEKPELYKEKECSKRQIIINQNKEHLFKGSYLFVEKFFDSSACKLDADILFLGQPLIEDDLESSVEKDFLKTVFQSLINLNKTVIIKPHPRENFNKYFSVCQDNDIVLIDGLMGTLPVECLVESFNVKFVIAYNSSAAMNISNAFPNIKVILMLKADFACEVSKKRAHNNMNYSDNIFTSANNIYLIESMDDMVQLLNMQSESSLKANKVISYCKFEEIDELFDKEKDAK